MKVLEQRPDESWVDFVDRAYHYLNKCSNCGLFFNRALGQAVIHHTRDAWKWGL